MLKYNIGVRDRGRKQQLRLESRGNVGETLVEIVGLEVEFSTGLRKIRY
jgi:hypothetical protein